MNAGREAGDGSPKADDLLTKLRHRASDSSGGTSSATHVPHPDDGLTSAALRPRLVVALALTVPVVALSLFAGEQTAARWVQVVLTGAVLAWCTRPLIGPAWADLRRLRPTPDVAVLLAAFIAWAHSLVLAIRGGTDAWFATAAVITTLHLFARRLEVGARESAGPGSPDPPAVRRLRTWFTPAVLAAAVVALGVWLASGATTSRALGVAVAVLVIASFPAAALAAPAAYAAARRSAARTHEPAPDPAAIATAARLDTVVINRADVLTTGDLALTKIAVLGRLSKKAALTAAAGVEQGSDHPIAKAIVAGAELARIALPRIRDFEANPGEGASARIKDTEVTVGKAALFEHVDPSLLAHADQTPGRTVYVGWDGRARAALTVADTVRDTSQPAVARLKRLGLAPYLLTDHGEAHARSVAQSVGIDPGKARSDAQSDSTDLVADLQRQGRRVSVIGRARPGLLFERDDLDLAADTVELGQRTQAVIRQSLGWAFAYAALAVPVAAVGLVHPALASAVSAVATLVPVVNGRRLDR